MTLLADYSSRWSTELRTNWSNGQNSTATTPNTTLEALAAADAAADFAAVCGVAYDSSNATHVTAGVYLVVLRLLLFTGQATQEAYDSQLNRLEKWYKLVLGRNRITPFTSSTLVPSTETADSKPWSDAMAFDRYVTDSGIGAVTDNPQSPQQD